MAVIVNVPINTWRLARNLLAGLRRPPDYVALDVSGSLPEFERSMSFLRRRIRPGSPVASLEGLRDRLEHISSDGRTQGVLLRVRNLDASWAALEDLREEIGIFRRKGGRVVAYLTEPDTRSYYLACAADEVFIAPVSTLNVVGVRTRVHFLRDALNQAGIEADVVAVSPYKSAGDPFVRNEFSRESREQAERLLERRFEALVDAISVGRGLQPEEVRRKIDRAPYHAPGALDEGLVDGISYEDGLPDRLASGNERARISDWDAARKVLKIPYRGRIRRRIGLVSLSGAIVRGRSRRLPVPLPLLGKEQAGDESVVAALRVAENDRRVAAVLFHVDSPGGDALASDLIWREVERIRGKKPVVVLMGALAASGGYYVSANANHVVARHNTITGSIGVILIRATIAGLLGKLGVNPVSIERGARAGLLDPSHVPTDDELSVLRDQLEFIYGEFKDRVARGRGIESEAMEEITGGRVWTGVEAHELGLVDEIGGFRAAVRRARSLGDIKDDALDVIVKITPPRKNRPAPGDPMEIVRTALDDVQQALSELCGAKIWAILPYELSDD